MRLLSLIHTLMVLIAIKGHAHTFQKSNPGIKAKINANDVEIQFYSL
jgi:hypothetical protein